MTERIFTPDQLEELDIPYTTLHDEQIDSRRWADTRSCVFRAPDDGKAYRVTYQVPATEHQECDTWFDQEQIKAVEVEQRDVVTKVWKSVGAPRTAPLTRLADLMASGQTWKGDRLVSERVLSPREIREALGWPEPTPPTT